MSFKDKFKSFFNTEEEYEYVEEYEEDTASSLPSTPSKDQKNVVNLSAIHQSTSKVMLCEPTSYNEVQEIADYILNKRAVVINLQNMDQHQAKRIIDFLSGTVYAVNGDIQKTGMATFLCAPENIDVSGSISKSTTQDAEFNKGW
ncbi:MAG TPA: cell division protein SepF [Pseudogracilibacillus sp.]|nr:cell division protein SepF [Pseudogracilibacillus sp.]